MKYLQTETYLGESEDAQDAVQSSQLARVRLAEIEQQELPRTQDPLQQLTLGIEQGYLLLQIDNLEDAWTATLPLLSRAVELQAWQQAVEACDILFQSEQPESVRALAHGIWLGVTFPIDPELSVAMLQHLVDESPDRSDGAAVAAASACYLVDLRAEGKQREDLQFFCNQLIGQVARRHSQVEEQEIFDFWIQQLELDDPGKFLPRLASVLDVLVGQQWWFDRDQLREQIPESA